MKGDLHPGGLALVVPFRGHVDEWCGRSVLLVERCALPLNAEFLKSYYGAWWKIQTTDAAMLPTARRSVEGRVMVQFESWCWTPEPSLMPLDPPEEVRAERRHVKLTVFDRGPGKVPEPVITARSI